MSDKTASDYRRIQITGRGSYVVSLPKKWVSDMGLSKGERIAVFKQSDGSLSLVPKESAGKESTRDRISGSKRYGFSGYHEKNRISIPCRIQYDQDHIGREQVLPDTAGCSS